MKSPQHSNWKKVFLLFTFIYYTSLLPAQSWTQVGVKVEGDSSLEQMGHSVNFNTSGTIFISGAPRNDENGDFSGQIKVYQNQAGDWLQIGESLMGEEVGDFFGFSTDINGSGNIIAVGAPSGSSYSDKSGSVRVFENQSGEWVQIGQTITGDNFEDQMGFAVSLNESGDILAVGANYHDGNGLDKTGQVKVFKYQSGTWNLMGNPILGENTGDILGTSLRLNDDGTRLVTGGTTGSTNQTKAGHISVFQFDGSSWNLLGSPLYGNQAHAGFGRSVSFNREGNILAVGAALNKEVFNFGGRAAIYSYNGTSWVQIGESIYGTHEFELTGVSVSLNQEGNIVAIGGSSNNIVGPFAGFTRVFRNQSGEWVQIGGHILAESFDDSCGYSVALNSIGDKIVVGSAGGYNNGTNSGHTRVFEIDLSTLSSEENPMSTRGISLFPNPSSGHITIKSSISINKIKIYDLMGKTVMKIANNNTINTIDISELNSGVYLIELFSEGTMFTKKLIRQ